MAIIAPPPFWVSRTGTMYPESVLSCILFATRYVRHLDRHGFLRFQDWKLYGERGLPRAKVTIWIYEGALRVEHRAVTLSQYEIKLQDDRKRVQTVAAAQAHETPFRSPQLTLFDLGPDGWLLYWKTEPAPPRRRRSVPSLLQLPLFASFPEEKAVGESRAGSASHSHPLLHLVGQPSEEQEE